MSSLDQLIGRLGILFTDPRLLESALTHRSFLHEHPAEALRLVDTERLEFLGDSILNYLVADIAFARFPDRGEGELTGIRAALVKTETLARFAREFDLGAFLRLSKGEESSGARNRTALLADVFEALVAAIYLDRGLDGVRAFTLPLFERELAHVRDHGLVLDFKSQLQARIQAERNITPSYHIIDVRGPEHRREFTVEVRAGDQILGTGQGASKQTATQEAARAALEQLAAAPDNGAPT